MSDIVVIGGGAAGMMAAVAAAGVDAGNNVILIEKNEKLGKKVFITGKRSEEHTSELQSQR